MAFKIFALCVFVAACQAVYQEEHHEEAYAPPKYEFAYEVKDEKTGDYHGQQETRDGDVVKGSYSLLDADGYLRTVEYSVEGKSGFNAVVKREPSHLKPAPAPAHHAPAPAPSHQVHSYAPAPQTHHYQAPAQTHHYQAPAQSHHHYAAAPVHHAPAPVHHVPAPVHPAPSPVHTHHYAPAPAPVQYHYQH